MRLFVSAVLFVLVPASSRAADDAVEKELKRLQGDWQVVGYKRDGVTASEDKFKRTVLRFEGTKMCSTANEKDVTRFKIDPTKTPAHWDITETSGDVTEAIYKFVGEDKLILCIPGGDRKPVEKRPKDFDAWKKEGYMLLELERVKKK